MFSGAAVAGWLDRPSRGGPGHRSSTCWPSCTPSTRPPSGWPTWPATTAISPGNSRPGTDRGPPRPTTPTTTTLWSTDLHELLADRIPDQGTARLVHGDYGLYNIQNFAGELATPVSKVRHNRGHQFRTEFERVVEAGHDGLRRRVRAPGTTALTRTPLVVPSMASTRVRPDNAHLGRTTALVG
jgi:hypothetical protein